MICVGVEAPAYRAAEEKLNCGQVDVCEGRLRSHVSESRHGPPVRLIEI